MRRQTTTHRGQFLEACKSFLRLDFKNVGRYPWMWGGRCESDKGQMFLNTETKINLKPSSIKVDTTSGFWELFPMRLCPWLESLFALSRDTRTQECRLTVCRVWTAGLWLHRHSYSLSVCVCTCVGKHVWTSEDSLKNLVLSTQLAGTRTWI